VAQPAASLRRGNRQRRHLWGQMWNSYARRDCFRIVALSRSGYLNFIGFTI
jgi:hypothetical protein